MNRIVLAAGVVLAAVGLAVAADAPTGNWPQWRGPKRDGVSTDTGLLTEWPKGGPKLVWEAKGAGRGYASVAVAGGRVYTMGDTGSGGDNTEFIVCYGAADGKELWKATLGPVWTATRQESWQSPRSTPTIDGDRLYVITPAGDLVCLATAENGKELWRKSLVKDFGGGKGDGWGYSESPLIDGDRVICTPGRATNSMVALEKTTGKKIWAAQVPNGGGAGHSSVVPAEVGGTRVYVQTTSSHILGVRAADGKVQWTQPIGATAVIPTPIVRGDLVFAGAGYGKGGTLLRQVPSGDGVKVEKVYDYKRELGNKHGGVVLVGDYVYGDSEDRGMVWCAKLETGEAQPGWKQRGSGTGSASIVAADGYLYIHYANGTMALAKADPAGYKESGTFKVPHAGGRPSWAHPVVAGGRLYVRAGDWLLCYDVSAK